LKAAQMIGNKPRAKNLFYKTILVLGIALLLFACDRNRQDGENISSEANVKVVKSVVTPKEDINPVCLPSTGNAMEDGQETVCNYNTDSLELAYAAIVKVNASKDDSGYSLLQKSLPSKDLEDNFDKKETWIKYKWVNNDQVNVTIQMAGGEDTLEFAKEANKVKVTTKLSAD
jgi:hypothetical protein